LLANALYVPQSLHISSHSDTPIDNIKRLLRGKRSGNRQPESPLFCEMLFCATDSADLDGTNLYWKQTNRFIFTIKKLNLFYL
jgi:hypothetical protein